MAGLLYIFDLKTKLVAFCLMFLNQKTEKPRVLPSHSNHLELDELDVFVFSLCTVKVLHNDVVHRKTKAINYEF